MIDLTVAEALAKAEHLKALGETTIYLYRGKGEGFPFDKVTGVEDGGTWRLGMPSSIYLYAEVDGLTFKLSVDLEQSDANGRGVAVIDRDKLRVLFTKLPEAAKQQFADMLESKCLPSIAERTTEIRATLQAQADSEDCVRGLIRLAREKVPA
jgi:hypothetical protein